MILDIKEHPLAIFLHRIYIPKIKSFSTADIAQINTLRNKPFIIERCTNQNHYTAITGTNITLPTAPLPSPVLTMPFPIKNPFSKKTKHGEVIDWDNPPEVKECLNDDCHNPSRNNNPGERECLDCWLRSREGTDVWKREISPAELEREREEDEKEDRKRAKEAEKRAKEEEKLRKKAKGKGRADQRGGGDGGASSAAA